MAQDIYTERTHSDFESDHGNSERSGGGRKVQVFGMFSVEEIQQASYVLSG